MPNASVRGRKYVAKHLGPPANLNLGEPAIEFRVPLTLLLHGGFYKFHEFVYKCSYENLHGEGVHPPQRGDDGQVVSVHQVGDRGEVQVPVAVLPAELVPQFRYLLPAAGEPRFLRQGLPGLDLVDPGPDVLQDPVVRVHHHYHLVVNRILLRFSFGIFLHLLAVLSATHCTLTNQTSGFFLWHLRGSRTTIWDALGPCEGPWGTHLEPHLCFASIFCSKIDKHPCFSQNTIISVTNDSLTVSAVFRFWFVIGSCLGGA